VNTFKSVLIQTLRELVRSEQGQDLVEYTLLLAFVLLASAGLVTGEGTSTASVWGTAKTTLANAASS